MHKSLDETPVSIKMVKFVKTETENPLIIGISNFHQSEGIVLRIYYKHVEVPTLEKHEDDEPSKLLIQLNA